MHGRSSLKRLLLYTPTDAATKYQAKAFIDMFLMRLGKGISAILILTWAAWASAERVQQLALISLAVIACWWFAARAVARQFTAQTEPGAPAPRSAANVRHDAAGSDAPASVPRRARAALHRG